MQGSRFDALTRWLSVHLSRRNALFIASGAVAARLSTTDQVARAGCKKVGKTCKKTKDCCSGARCKGGKKGKCRCKSGFSQCNKRCYRLDSDPAHCGACNTACSAGQGCCAGACTDLSTNPAACGACQIVCSTNETCCDGACADLTSDPAHCGACGEGCGPGEECIEGACWTSDGCPVGADSCAGNDVFCGSDSCACARSTEGATICGSLETPGAVCGQCQTSDDCAAFGPGAFCVAAATELCCGTDGGNVCRLPCDS